VHPKRTCSHPSKGISFVCLTKRYLLFVSGTYRLVLLDVQPDGGTRRTGSRETNDKSASILELDVQSLVLGHAVIDGVGVLKVTGLRDLAARNLAADERALSDLISKRLSKSLSSLRGDVLVVVTGEESTCVILFSARAPTSKLPDTYVRTHSRSPSGCLQCWGAPQSPCPFQQ
jgi:hypothetical protein